MSLVLILSLAANLSRGGGHRCYANSNIYVQCKRNFKLDNGSNCSSQCMLDYKFVDSLKYIVFKCVKYNFKQNDNDEISSMKLI